MLIRCCISALIIGTVTFPALAQYRDRQFDPRFDRRDDRDSRRDGRRYDRRQGESEPTITVSPQYVARGGTATVSWDGGPDASTCAVFLSDATRTNYQPWESAVTGSQQVADLSSTTIFSMTCIDRTGGYLPGPTPTATIDVE
jgi:hypothetical protein